MPSRKFKPFQNDNFSDGSNLEEFADDNNIVTEKLKLTLGRVDKRTMMVLYRSPEY